MVCILLANRAIERNNTVTNIVIKAQSNLRILDIKLRIDAFYFLYIFLCCSVLIVGLKLEATYDEPFVFRHTFPVYI